MLPSNHFTKEVLLVDDGPKDAEAKQEECIHITSPHKRVFGGHKCDQRTEIEKSAIVH